MKHVEGAAAPFPFYTWCSAAQRYDALLSHALQAFQDGDFADALLAVEAVCRSAKSSALPLVLRARIVETCRPELSAKAWYCAWLRDPENPVLQDSLLTCWLQAQAVQKVQELGRILLPRRCRDGNHAALLALLQQAGTTRVGVCWTSSNHIWGRVFQLDRSASCATFVQVHNETDGTMCRIALTGQQSDQFDLPWPDGGTVLSITIGDTDALLAGSPLTLPLAAPVLPVKHETLRPSRKAVALAQGEVDIIIPVFRGLAQVKACLESVLGSLPQNRCAARIIVVDDASPEPALSAWLDNLAHSGACVLLRNRHNLGFVGSVNRALALDTKNDVMLLNADTLVHGNWLDRLRTSLYGAPDLASVTAWSNNAEISSFPIIAQAAYAPSKAELVDIDAACANLQHDDLDIPVCCGFAMMMRRTVLNRIGLLDGAGFGRGYGEEVDWCLRARAAGYRHRLAVKVFIAHVGGISFGVEKILRVRQNRAVLQARYPAYYPEYDQFVQSDGLRSARSVLHQRLQHDPWLQRLSATPPLFLPASLPAGSRWLAIWHFEIDSPCAPQVLALARAMAGIAQCPLRLLICGEINNALWHTGVVDHLPAGVVKDALFSDEILLALCGCVAVLAETQHRIAAEIPNYVLDCNFTVSQCLLDFGMTVPDQIKHPAQQSGGTVAAKKRDNERELTIHGNQV